jgi:hypothetical protein
MPPTWLPNTASVSGLFRNRLSLRGRWKQH